MLKLVNQIEAHKGRGWSVTWNSSGTKLASCGEDKSVKVWSNSTTTKNLTTESLISKPWKLASTFGTNHSRSIRDVAWSPCDKYVVVASFDAIVTLWEERPNGKFDCLSTVEGHEHEVKSVSWAPSGQYFSSCSRDKNVMIWTVVPDDDGDVECSGVMTAHTQDVKRVVWHPHEDLLASASYDDSIKMYKIDPDSEDWLVVATLEGHESTVWGIDFDSTGNRLASCSDDKTIKIWEKQDGKQDVWKCASTIGGCHDRPIYDISWNKSNGLIATGCGDDYIRIFKESQCSNETEKNLFELCCTSKGHEGDVNRIKWNPKVPDLLASIGDDGIVKLWQWIED